MHSGWCIFVKHSSWSEGISGYIANISDTEIIVQYNPDIHNVRNHFFIPVLEVVNGEWEIRVSDTLKDVYEFVIGSGEDEVG